MQVRREIDGLRAAAVMPVVCFHAGLPPFRGGFVGVDVFFVVSGYLITSIILAECEAGSFSLMGFYERRARRILPALFAVMLACVPFSWLWMMPEEYKSFGQSLVATTAFSNNVLLWLTSGYFSLANEFKPLVHTWSLGVEEQFYLVFPVFLLGLLRLPPNWRGCGLMLIGAGSFALSVWLGPRDPIASFFLLPTRLWELLLGACVPVCRTALDPIFRPSAATAQVGSLCGLFLIAYAVLQFDAGTPYPGVYTLVPTLGTLLILLYGTPETYVGHLLAHRWLVGLGLISYSVYLWHQPLFAFARLVSLDEPHPTLMLALVAASVVLGAVSWRFIEQPFRDRRRVVSARLTAAAVITGGALASMGLVLHVNGGFLRSWPEYVIAAGRDLNAAYNDAAFAYKDRPFEDGKHHKVLVLGNSFARDFINAALANGYFSDSALSYSDDVPMCLHSADQIALGLRKRIQQADYVIFGSPTIALSCWRTDFAHLQALGAKSLIVIGTKNFGRNNNAIVRLPAKQRFGYRARVLEEVWLDNKEFAAALPSHIFIDVLALLADENGRVPVFTEDGRFISPDTKHLTRDGALFLGKLLFEQPPLQSLK